MHSCRFHCKQMHLQPFTAGQGSHMIGKEAAAYMKSTSQKVSPPAAYQNLAKSIRSCRLQKYPLLPLTLPRAYPLMPPFGKVYKKLDSEAVVQSADI